MEKLVVIGGVAAGMTAAARARRCCEDAQITVYEQGEHISYASCGLPYFISGVAADANMLIARTPGDFKRLNNIDVLTRHRVISVNPEKKKCEVVDLSDGSKSYCGYTKLLLSTGATAFVPPIAGKDLDGVFVLRTMSDGLSIKEFIKKRAPRRAAVIGAGPVGLEMCESFRSLGLEVTLVEAAGQVMPSVHPDLAVLVLEHLEENGVRCLLGERLESIEGRNGAVRGVITDGNDLEADIVLMGIGIRPVTDIPAEAGAELGVKGAVRVDRYMRTGIPDIYAAGDCATTTNAVTGDEAWIPLGSTSRKQGRVAADNMFGAQEAFPGVLGTSIVKCFDLTVGRTGLDESQAREAGFDPVEVSIETRSLPGYYPGADDARLKVVADRGNGRLLGAQVVGKVGSNVDKRLDVLAVSVGAALTAGDIRYLDLAYAPPYSTAVDSPLVAGNLLAGRIEGKTCFCDSDGLE